MVPRVAPQTCLHDAAQLGKGRTSNQQVMDVSIESATARQIELPSHGLVGVLRSSRPRAKGSKLPMVDFADYLYMPLLKGLNLDPEAGDERPLAWIFGDEQQDNSRVRMLMVKALQASSAASCRVCIVGDDMQALYGWAFAMNGALQEQRRCFKPCQMFDLPLCRRCPTAHIALANEVMQKAAEMDRQLAGAGEVPPPMAPMQAAPGAIEGQIFRDKTFKSYPLGSTALLVSTSASRTAAGRGAAISTGCLKGTAILARRNAPLLALLYSLVRRGIACRMLGKAPLSQKILELLRQLSIDGRSCGTLDELEWALDGHVRREADRRDEQEGDDTEYATADLAECVRTLLGVVREARAQARRPRDRPEVGEIEQLREEINGRFGSAKVDQARPLARDARDAPVELSTVHKAKGLGWGVVFLLEPQELPLRFVMDAGGWQARQELNVQYVAYTRSEATLVFLKNVVPQQRPEGWSLKAAIESVLFEEGEDAGGCALPKRRRAYTEAERNQAAWETWGAHCNHDTAEAAAAGASDGTTSQLAMSVAEARVLLKLPAEAEQPAGQLPLQAIFSAYRRCSLEAHPDRADRNGVSAEKATELFRRLFNARKLLETENAQLVDGVSPSPCPSSPSPCNDSSPPHSPKLRSQPASPSSARRPPATPTTARATARATAHSTARATAGSTPKRRQQDSPAGEPSPRCARRLAVRTLNFDSMPVAELKQRFAEAGGAARELQCLEKQELRRVVEEKCGVANPPPAPHLRS